MDYRNVWNKFGLKKAACLVAGLAAFGLADNPISTYHYLADPGAAADDDYFYIITDSDDPAPANADGYKIYALYAFRSRDMQNWTDYGIIYDARKVSGINDIWASGIAVHNGTFYIVFPDGGGGGIGYIKAPAIEGPWSNAVGNGKTKLVGGSGIIGCDGVSWCFDPGIFIDDDGTTYVTWGGGESTSRPNTDNFDIVKLNDAKNAPVGNGSHVKVNNLPKRKMLEASYIHKHKGTYYFSYSTGWQDGAPTIDYGTSDNVMGPYTWKGTILGDPSMNGRSINGNNNHHGIAEFKGHSYVVYHDRRIAKGHNGLEVIPADDGRANPNEGYHRSVSVDEMFYNADGTIKQVVCTNEGPEQIENFDPYDWYPALTSSKQKGVRSRSNFVQGKAAEHVLLPLSSKESWLRVSGVDFGTAATGFTVEAASVAEGNKIEIRTGSATGTLAGTCNLKTTSNKNTYAMNECEVEGLKGIVKQLFLVFKGNQDSTMAIKAWGFEGSGTTPPTPQSPFGGTAWAIPGKIEMENFDEPGVGRGSDLKSYSDNDAEDHGVDNGGTSYREGTGVDIYKKATGYVVGYNQAGEWLEYTVNVKEAGDYTMYAAVASANATSSFQLSIDGDNITEEISVPQASSGEDNYDDYNKVKANVKLPAGEHILRFTVTGDWMDIDYINFVAGKDAVDSDPLGGTTAIAADVKLGVPTVTKFDVFSLNGKKIASFVAHNMAEATKIWQSGSVKGTEKAEGICLIRSRSTGAVAKVRSIR
ncbi:carbohydrate-binding protein [Fibrobacter sp.]|uniref:carbohydrate-binding protein n=1 Tax=Fibrobacter sp. TaxID=35828 RepID=UPI003864DFF1